MKKILTILLAISMLMTFVLPSFAFSPDVYYASKKATTDTANNKYTITLAVPGEEYKTQAGVDEYVIMLDKSTSNFSNSTAMKNAIKEIGRSILKNDRSVLLTIMDFGMNSHIMFQFDHTDDLATLPDGNFSNYDTGIRSATNIEGAFHFWTII